MDPDARKYLRDIGQAIKHIEEFTNGRSFADYESNVMLRSAVERQFMIVGEAMGLLARTDREAAASITGSRRIIDFRNLLVHGYASIDDRLVWGTVEDRVPTLRREVEALLAQE